MRARAAAGLDHPFSLVLAKAFASGRISSRAMWPARPRCRRDAGHRPRTAVRLLVRLGPGHAGVGGGPCRRPAGGATEIRGAGQWRAQGSGWDAVTSWPLAEVLGASERTDAALPPRRAAELSRRLARASGGRRSTALVICPAGRATKPKPRTGPPWTRPADSRPGPELRAATSLARLAAARRPAAVRDLLAPVLARFTEGLDAPDPKAARELLERLRSP